MFTEVGSAAAGFTLALTPAILGDFGRVLPALAIAAALAITTWPVAGDLAAVSVAAGAAGGLIVRFGIAAVLARRAGAR